MALLILPLSNDDARLLGETLMLDFTTKVSYSMPVSLSPASI
jgi:hypothetical protein